MNHVLKTFREVYGKPKYLFLNLIIFLAYYFGSYLLVKLQSKVVVSPGILTTYAFFLVLFTSSVVITMAVYFLRKRNSGKAAVAGGIESVAAAFLASLVFSCGCSIPVFFSLATLGLSSASALSLDLTFSSYAPQIMVVASVFNILVIYYYSVKNNGKKNGKIR
jgi:hypothetical protein